MSWTDKWRWNHLTDTIKDQELVSIIYDKIRKSKRNPVAGTDQTNRSVELSTEQFINIIEAYLLITTAQ